MIARMLDFPKNQSFFLFGPRQTGKSTLLRSLYLRENTLWYDLLKTEEYTRLIAYPHLLREEVLSRGKEVTHVIIDEIQRIPDLLNEIHWLMEQPRAPYFILTVSSARKLKRSHANLLGGRALNFYLFPFTAQELGEQFLLHRALQFGTLPSVFLEKDDNLVIEKLRAYVDVYLKEEIEQEIQTRQLGPFVRFLSFAAQENGNQINFSNIAQDTSVSPNTIKSYFQILEDTLVGQFLFPYSRTSRQRLSKQPKFYFFDTGVVRALQKKLTSPLTAYTPEYGSAFEHFIVIELLRYISYNRLDYTVSYYRTAAGAEVDLIIETPQGHVIAIEIKAKDVVLRKDLRGLRSFSTLRQDAHLACVTLAPRRRVIDQITLLPWQELFTWIEEIDK